MNLDKYKRGFTVTGKHRIETTDFYLTTFWILSRDSMSDNFLQFFAYDANLYPTPDFSTWKDNKFKQKQIKKALEFTKDFYGEVWLDDVKIKEKSEMENYKQFSNMKQKATESEINNYQQFENMQFLKPHELGGSVKEIRVRLKNYYSDQTFELREVNSSLNLIVIYDHTEGTYSTKSLDKVIEVELVEVN